MNRTLFDPEWMAAVMNFNYAFHTRAAEVKQRVREGGALAMKLAGVA